MAKKRNEAKYLFGNIPRPGSKYPKRDRADIPDGIRKRKVEISFDQFSDMFQKIGYDLSLSLHNYAVDISIRALTVFRKSFSERRFYSGDGKSWPMLTDTTIKKRIRRGTWRDNAILNEYGNLYSSLTRKSSVSTVNRFIESVYTDPSRFPGGRAYGGVHNDPRPGDTYGTIFGAKPVKRRQFMGFSTYIDNFENKYIDRYLFHSVFGVPAQSSGNLVGSPKSNYYI